MCQPDYSLQDDSRKLLNASSENIIIPLPDFPEETVNDTDGATDDAFSTYQILSNIQDRLEEDEQFSRYNEETLPIVSVNHFDNNVETLGDDINRLSSLNYQVADSAGPRLFHLNNNHHNFENSIPDYHLFNNHRSLDNNRRRRRRRRAKKRQQIRQNLKSINKFLRKTLRTLQQMKSLMTQQVELVQTIHNYGYAAE